MADKYLWGTHASALANAEGLKSRVSPSAVRGAVSAVAIAFLFTPQQAYTDVQPQIYRSVVAGATPRTIQRVFSDPQYDLTVQSKVWGSQSAPVVVASRLSTFIIAAPVQADFTQQSAFWTSGLPIGRVPPLTTGI